MGRVLPDLSPDQFDKGIGVSGFFEKDGGKSRPSLLEHEIIFQDELVYSAWILRFLSK